MTGKISLRLKLLGVFLFGTFISILGIGLIAYFISHNIVTSMANAEIDDLTQSFFGSAKAAYSISQNMLSNNIIIAESLIKNRIELDAKKTVTIQVVNQASMEEKKETIPLMLINGDPVIRDTSTVDEITKTYAEMATIFQIIPEGMLRISTTVRKPDGSRAVGTYIPYDSPVFQSIIKGNSYIGRAFIANDWYNTAYKPIFDDDNKVIGAMFIGIKISQTGVLASLKKELGSIRIGKSGYMYIIDPKGTLLLHPTQEGKNIYDSVDAKGNYFIREICSNKNGTIIYPWMNPGEKKPRDKIVIYKYFEENDWIIASGAYIDEIYSPIYVLQRTMIVVGIIALIIVTILAILLANSISKPINKMTEDLFSSSNSLESAANQVSSSSQELSSGASELASSVEEMTSSLEELQSIIESTTKNINEAELMMKNTMEGSRDVTAKMNGMQNAMTDISDNSRKIAKIIKVIDDIAFQTNILALNAAVEAARAGDAGRGFAVVAEQVKNLAQKSADAAKETADLIDKAGISVNHGEKIGKEVQDVQLKAGEMAQKVGNLLDEVNRAAKEELKGANQITKAVSQINTVVQGTAATSEESASAGEELLSQAEMLKGVVVNLNELVMGSESQKKAFEKREIKDNEKKAPGKRVELISRNTAPKQEVRSIQLSHKDDDVEIIKPEDKIPLQDFKDF